MSRLVRGTDYFSILERGIRDLASAIRNALANYSRVSSASD